ncbi:MAG: autotransporter outer membrane beta-barrel domain-containing protein [Hyphomicrobiales bacterium]|nr:autotransporter outer membrane beta-barrel domain-containing protein [Hyphomicrobiales bacterium]MCY4053681.1 autotransporter outer membrane beta-barrel domain-containing protein [Hyphomicrobiales bacterium]
MNASTQKPFLSELTRDGRSGGSPRGLVSLAAFPVGASLLALGALLATASPAEAATPGTAASETARECAAYEVFPVMIAHLAAPESHRQRLQSRRRGNNGGIWIKVSGGSNEFEPLSGSLAVHEIDNAFTVIGADAALDSYGNFTIGGNVSIGQATTDVTVEAGTAEIFSPNFKAAFMLNWKSRRGAFAVGHVQYSAFNNEIKTDSRLVDTGAGAFSAGFETGYDVAIGNFHIVPSMHLAWTSVHLDDFNDSGGTPVRLDDGVVITGRAGIGMQYDWRGVLRNESSSGALLRIDTGIVLPLDGDVKTRIGEMKLTSEIDEPIFEVGVGVTYTWNETYALSVDVSSNRGEEAEGYTGTLGFTYNF